MSRKYWMAAILILSIGLAGWLSLSINHQRVRAGVPDDSHLAGIILPTAEVIIFQDHPDPSLPEESVSVGVRASAAGCPVGLVTVTNGTYSCTMKFTMNNNGECRRSGLCGLRFPKKVGSYTITATLSGYYTGTDTEAHTVSRR